MDVFRIVREYEPIAPLYPTANWFLEMRKPLEQLVVLGAEES
jgi:hypothetical protein